jgi:hypothetical protein
MSRTKAQAIDSTKFSKIKISARIKRKVRYGGRK